MSVGLYLAAAQDDSELGRLRRELAQTQLALARTRVELVAARREAHHDTLTGLSNRRGFDTVSKRAMAAHGAGDSMLALLFVDLDGFKAVNDRLGHAVGDELLRIVGARLSGAMRRGDLVCRQGGDEFLCLLPRLHKPARAADIAEHVVRAISSPCQIGPHSVTVRASIGVALYPRDGATLSLLLRHADRAMYAAKAAGCGLVMSQPTTCPTAPSLPNAGCTVARPGTVVDVRRPTSTGRA